MYSENPHLVYISLGSNQGDRLANLTEALRLLLPAVAPLSYSPIYQTPPWGFADQDDFLNQVIKAQTALSPQELLVYLKEVEVRLGRQPTFRYGPRLIDLDILFYDEQVLQSEGLVIPHPKLHERAFVLLPLSDLAPELRHPILGKTVTELLCQVSREGIYVYSTGKDAQDG